MKIQFGHPRIIDFEKEFYGPLTQSFPEHDILLPHLEGREGPNSKETLKEQDLFLCDVSYPAIGLWIEIGFAHLYNVRIICMYKKGSEVTSILKYFTEEVFEYKNEEDMIKQLKNIL